MGGLVILIIFLIGIALYDIVIYNQLVFLKQKSQEAWSGIDVQLKRRHDLIPQLVTTVKAYAKYEQDLLERIVRDRNTAIILEKNSATQNFTESEKILAQDISAVFMLAEKYPDLKANQNFLRLQEEISETEDHVAASRTIYNQNTNRFNTKIQSFPAIFVARLHGFTKLKLF